MRIDQPLEGSDERANARHLSTFYVSLLPVGMAALGTLFVESFLWFLVIMLVGFTATVALAMRIMPRGVCANCHQPISSCQLKSDSNEGQDV
jgi:hypothetical protein